jgi:hypothetical protein
MQPFIAWVDESPEKMDAVRRYIKAMEQEGALDLLGFGSILNRYSNIFFPAVSTIMTRARYYIFIPALFKDIEKHRLSSSAAFNKLNSSENKIRDLLYNTDSSDTGIIGRNAGDKINAHPSDIYWGGIRELGIFRNSKLSKYQYIKSLKEFYHYMDEKTGGIINDEEESHFEYSWDPSFKFTFDFNNIKTLSFNLRRQEAEYLSRIFHEHAEDHGESIMTWLLDNSKDEMEYPNWPNMQEMINKSRATAALKRHVNNACSFRLLAACLEQLYYLFLSKKKYGESSYQYSAALDSLMNMLGNKNLISVIKDSHNWIHEVATGDEQFFFRMIEEMNSCDFNIAAVVSSPVINNMIVHREYVKKKHKARLTYSEAMNSWRSDNPRAGYLDYRLYTGFNIAMDIIRGFHA